MTPQSKYSRTELIIFRYTSRSQDAKAWNEKKEPFVRAFHDVETATGYLLHGWLQSPRNGMSPNHESLTVDTDTKVRQNKKQQSSSNFALLVFQRFYLHTTSFWHSVAATSVEIPFSRVWTWYL